MRPVVRIPESIGLRPGGSLALRLVLVAAVWSAAALAVAGVVLTELYRESIVRGFDARLDVYRKAIAGQVASADGVVPDLGGLGEPRFLLPLTGWYWIVRDARTGATLDASRSLFGEVLEVPAPPDDGTARADYMRGPGGAELRFVVQRLDVGADRRFDVVVTGNPEELAAEVSAFRLRVFATLIVFAAGLVLATVLQVRFGLKPLDQMRRSLAAIREGRATRLQADLPREIAPLGQELNALIETNGAIVERARGHVGNLAHALKTPLSVMLNEARAEEGPLAAKVIEQAGLMRAEVDRYLDRARAAAGRRVVGATADVMRSVESLAKVLRRAHLDRAVEIETDGSPDVRARIERRDLEELVGNLMDNACKFGRGRVRVTVAPDTRAAADRPMVTIAVEDDGAGLPEDKYADVIGRGRRLDETVPGSGLGLAIADEIVEAYGGRMVLGRSEMGGLRVTVEIPQS
jgi:signal transduction histidine kinase